MALAEDSVASSQIEGHAFTLVHGPPGTGKTHTIWGILNLVHLVCFQRYYKTISEVMKQMELRTLRRGQGHADPTGAGVGAGHMSRQLSRHQATTLYNCLINADLADQKQTLQRIAPKPRILVCAPSNAAVDELCKRVVDLGFRDMNFSKYVDSSTLSLSLSLSLFR